MLLHVAVISGFLLVAAALPDGNESAQWGMTVEQLRQKAPVQKVELGHGYGYAEHGETQPDVYAQAGDGQKHREYYFFRGKLYKIFTVYARNLSQPELYTKLIDEQKKALGEPGRQYEDQMMGMRVLHTEWSDNQTIIDLRMGAGFIFEVRIDVTAAREKQVLKSLKNSI